MGRKGIMFSIGYCGESASCHSFVWKGNSCRVLEMALFESFVERTWYFTSSLPTSTSQIVFNIEMVFHLNDATLLGVGTQKKKGACLSTLSFDSITSKPKRNHHQERGESSSCHPSWLGWLVTCSRGQCGERLHHP